MRLPDDVLARRAALPAKPAAVTLVGPTVTLRPLELAADVPALFEAQQGADHIWRWMSGGPFADAAALRAWLAPQVLAADGAPLVVLDRHTTPVGVANFLANQPAHLKIELGSIWYVPAAQRTGISAEVTHLMLGHAFGLGYRRLEWKCDARNEPSRRAALAYGFTFEGIQDAHYIVKDENRDTAWFRMLDREWPERGPRLAARAHAQRCAAG